ncbi:hypothetical protein [Streptomyces calidiresistens]|uniref:Uncharacterized protein n=1 Tax=Streptomyces calidiresistens TaxID=1485586 RepID=A0A7W3SZP8_9ACTN|nr:hypothetical protein [Streptomyces calidiresistens]MBB0227951.1 hypothetical protein [Streptomyces calidiresistens]
MVSGPEGTPIFGRFVYFVEVLPVQVMDILLGIFVRIPVRTPMSHLKEAARENPRPLSQGLRRARGGEVSVSEAEDLFCGAARVWGVLCGGSILLAMLLDATVGASFDLALSVFLSLFSPFLVMGFVQYVRAGRARRKFLDARNAGRVRRKLRGGGLPNHRPLRHGWLIPPIGMPVLYVFFYFVVFV